MDENDERPPQVGDVWVYDDGGKELLVTAVEPPQPERGWYEWRVALGDDPMVTHIGWWYGQGWSPKEG